MVFVELYIFPFSSSLSLQNHLQHSNEIMYSQHNFLKNKEALKNYNSDWTMILLYLLILANYCEADLYFESSKEVFNLFDESYVKKSQFNDDEEQVKIGEQLAADEERKKFNSSTFLFTEPKLPDKNGSEPDDWMTTYTQVKSGHFNEQKMEAQIYTQLSASLTAAGKSPRLKANTAKAASALGALMALLTRSDSAELKATILFSETVNQGFKALHEQMRIGFNGLTNQIHHLAFLQLIGVPFKELMNAVINFSNNLDISTMNELLFQCDSGKLLKIFAAIKEYVISKDVSQSYFYNELKKRFFVYASFAEMKNKIVTIMKYTVRIHDICNGIKTENSKSTPMLELYLNKSMEYERQIDEMEKYIKESYWRLGVRSFACNHFKIYMDATVHTLSAELEKEEHYGHFSSFNVMVSDWAGSYENGGIFDAATREPLTEGTSANYILESSTCVKGRTFMITKRPINDTLKPQPISTLGDIGASIYINVLANKPPRPNFQQLTEMFVWALQLKSGLGSYIHVTKDLQAEGSKRVNRQEFTVHLLSLWMFFKKSGFTVHLFELY